MRIYLKLKKADMQIASVIAIFYIFIKLHGIGCQIRFFTGISCAGCGMTREWTALIQGNIVAAFHYHPFLLRLF